MGAADDNPALAWDVHAHSVYSDGAPLEAMVEAARDAGLDGVGFADHSNVSTLEPGVNRSFDLSETYPDRRHEIQTLREEYDLRIFDAVELDYRPADEEHITSFLDEAAFDYTLGSVHHVEQTNVVVPGTFADASEDERETFVDKYFDLVVDLVESELFDVVAHIDLTQRNAELRDHATTEHYRTVAEALAKSETVPELNAGRAFGDFGEVHPHPDFLDVLQEAEIEFVAGTDAHAPDELVSRAEPLSEVITSRGIDIVDPR